MVKYRISHKAEVEIEDIIEVIKQDNIVAANKWFSYLHKKCRSLGNFPHMGRIRNDLMSGVYVFPFGNYLIFYDIDPEGIVILHVVDARRDVPSLFP